MTLVSTRIISVTVRFPEPMWARLATAAEQNGVSKAAIVRLALNDWLKE